MNRTAHRRSWRFAASIACCNSSPNSVRFGNPVNSSCVARYWTLSSAVLRTVMSSTIGDVVQQRAVGRAPRRARYPDPDRRAVLADVALFDRQGIDRAFVHARTVAVREVHVVGMGDVFDGALEQLVVVVPEHLAEPAVAPNEPAVGRDVRNADGRKLYRAGVARFAFAQLALERSALGDVVHAADDGDRSSAGHRRAPGRAARCASRARPRIPGDSRSGHRHPRPAQFSSGPR